MLKFLKSLLLIFCFSSNSFAMLNKSTATTDFLRKEAVDYIKTDIDLKSYQILEIIIKNPVLLEKQRTIDIILNTDTHILKKLLTKDYLPQFTPIFLSQSSDEKFLSIVHANRTLLEKPEFQKRFFSLNKDKIVEFISSPENAHLLDIIADKSPDKIFKHLYNIGHKTFIESPFVIERFKQLPKEIGLISNVKKPFIIIKDASCDLLIKIAEYFYGSYKVNPETEKYIRDIGKDAWISQKYEIRKLDQAYLDKKPGTKAFALFNTLFVNENYIISGSDSDKRTLISHELKHIEKRHSYENLAFMIADTALTGVSYGLLAVNTKLFIDSKSGIHKLLIAGSSLGSTVGILELKNKLSEFIIKKAHEHEFEADKSACRSLNNKEDAINFLQSLGDEFTQQISTDTHPSIQSRINALSEFVVSDYSTSLSSEEDKYIIFMVPPKGLIDKLTQQYDDLPRRLSFQWGDCTWERDKSLFLQVGIKNDNDEKNENQYIGDIITNYLSKGDIPQLDKDGQHTGKWFSGERYVALKSNGNDWEFTNQVFDRNLRVLDLQDPKNREWLNQKIARTPNPEKLPNNIRLIARENQDFRGCSLEEFITLDSKLQNSEAAQAYLYHNLQLLNETEFASLPLEIQKSEAGSRRYYEIGKEIEVAKRETALNNIFGALAPELQQDPSMKMRLQEYTKSYSGDYLLANPNEIVNSFNVPHAIRMKYSSKEDCSDTDRANLILDKYQFDRGRIEAIQERFSINLLNSIGENETDVAKKISQKLYRRLDDLAKLKLTQKCEEPFASSIKRFANAAQDFKNNNELEKAKGMIYVMKQVGIFFDGFCNHATERGVQTLVSYIPGRAQHIAIMATLTFTGAPVWAVPLYAIGSTLYNIYHDGHELKAAISGIYKAVSEGDAYELGDSVARLGFTSRDILWGMKDICKAGQIKNVSKKVFSYINKGISDTRKLEKSAPDLNVIAQGLDRFKPSSSNAITTNNSVDNCGHCKLYPPKPGKPKIHRMDKKEFAAMGQKEKEARSKEFKRQNIDGKQASSVLKFDDLTHLSNLELWCKTDRQGNKTMELSGFHHDHLGKLQKHSDLKILKTKTGPGGTYKCDISYEGAESKESTMFPDDATRCQVISWIREAYHNIQDRAGKSVYNKDTMRLGIANINGEDVKIKFIFKERGEGITIITAHPDIDL